MKAKNNETLLKWKPDKEAKLNNIKERKGNGDLFKVEKHEPEAAFRTKTRPVNFRTAVIHAQAHKTGCCWIPKRQVFEALLNIGFLSFYQWWSRFDPHLIEKTFASNTKEKDRRKTKHAITAKSTLKSQNGKKGKRWRWLKSGIRPELKHAL